MPLMRLGRPTRTRVRIWNFVLWMLDCPTAWVAVICFEAVLAKLSIREESFLAAKSLEDDDDDDDNEDENGEDDLV